MNTGLSFPPIYLPWSPFSLTPDQVQHITSLIFARDMSNVVEIGGGVSTPCIAWAMMHMTPHPNRRSLHTIEDHPNWRKQIEALFYATTTATCSLNDFFLDWFLNDGTESALNFMEERSQADSVDLVIIDGPCANEDQYIRLCNVDFVKRCHRPGLLVYVDDTNRVGEQKLLMALTQLGECTIDTRKENYAIIEYK